MEKQGDRKNKNTKKGKEKEQTEAQNNRLLPLFDEHPSWMKNPSASTRNDQSMTEEAKRERLASRIRAMKNYNPEDLQEETAHCVSTELSLYHHDISTIRARMSEDPFKIRKRLTGSDLNDLCRLMVSSELVEQHILPHLNAEEKRKVNQEGLEVSFLDVDTGSTHGLTFRRWPTSRSYVFNGDWNKKFVRGRKLKAGDEIGIFWNIHNSKLNFSVLSQSAAADDNQVQQ